MTDRFPDSPGPHWGKLSELTLSVGANADEIIQAWLVDVLSPLYLPDHFLNRVLLSAQDYVRRALQQNIETGLGHLHLSIVVPNPSSSGGSTWGFFRIEKIDGTEQPPGYPEHTVEFYLYVEGQ